jgi:hypothetical protein
VKNLKQILAVSVGVLLISGIAFAAAQASAPAAPATAPAPSTGGSSLMNWLLSVLHGAGGGLLASLLGWLKNKNIQTGEHEGFDLKWAVPTVALGSVLGGVAKWLDLAPDTLMGAVKNLIPMIAATFTAEASLKGIWRHGLVMVKSWVRDWATAHSGAPAAK